MEDIVTGGGHGPGKSLHDPCPNEHSPIGHPRHVDHLSIDTQQRGHVIQDRLCVGEVIPT